MNFDKKIQIIISVLVIRQIYPLWLNWFLIGLKAQKFGFVIFSWTNPHWFSFFSCSIWGRKFRSIYLTHSCFLWERLIPCKKVVISSANWLILASTDCGNVIPRQLVDCLILWARISTPNTNNKGLSGYPCRTPFEKGLPLKNPGSRFNSSFRLMLKKTALWSGAIDALFSTFVTSWIN